MYVFLTYDVHVSDVILHYLNIQWHIMAFLSFILYEVTRFECVKHCGGMIEAKQI